MVIVFAQGTPKQASKTGIIFIVIHIIDSNICYPPLSGQNKNESVYYTDCNLCREIVLGYSRHVPVYSYHGDVNIISESIPDFKPGDIAGSIEK